MNQCTHLTWKEYKAQLMKESQSPLGTKIDTDIKIKQYINTAYKIIDVIDEHRSNKSYEYLYIMLFRFVSLFARVIKIHPDYKLFKDDGYNLGKICSKNFDELENVNEILKKKFESLKQLKLDKELSGIYNNEIFTTSSHHSLNKNNESNIDKVNDCVNAKNIVNKVDTIAFKDLQPVKVDSNPINHIKFNKTSIFPTITDNDSQVKQQLIPVNLSMILVDMFLYAAFIPLSQDIECCGVLCGSIFDEQYYLTHVIIPKQEATKDTCNCLDEIEVFEYQQKHDLITLGWIHTHPTQDAFLSSIDCHMAVAYQLQLPEAISIVCAPKKKPDMGIFRIVDNAIPILQNCKQTGFHKHEIDGNRLFETVKHVTIYNNVKTELIDLR